MLSQAVQKGPQDDDFNLGPPQESLDFNFLVHMWGPKIVKGVFF